MDLLKRELAPVTAEAWSQIDDEARRVLRLHLAGRKLVDFCGPRGWELGAINTGRVHQIEQSPVEFVAHSIREVLPLVELRVPIALDIKELDSATRGAKDLNLDAVIASAERLARAEDIAIFDGFSAGGIAGIIEATPHTPITVHSSVQWPGAVSAAREKLRLAGVNGPYALALGSAAYDELSAGSDDGYPLRKRIEESFSDGSFVWAPALQNGAVLLSKRGGDYELIVGQDLAIGYATHDSQSVELYLTETFTFRVLERKAAIVLRRSTDGTP